MNTFRRNPNQLAKKLELIRSYLDPETNILSEPDKIQIQMVEGDEVFKEAIQFLRSLKPLKPLQWDENLALSAQEHVNDIGPKGLLLYQSSDGTEPEDRIGKYGNYSESLGENIDFGPNDAMGVIVSLTLDDGEEQRPHRENLFKDDYQKVGIACGPHKSEFQMCVMDFAYDFEPLNNNLNNLNQNQADEVNIKMNKEDMMNNSNYNQNYNQNQMQQNPNNQSPLVKLSLEDSEQGKLKETQQGQNANVNNNVMTGNQNAGLNNNVANGGVSDITFDTINALNRLKIVSKKVEVVTKVTYTYDDGSTRVTTQTESHEFKG